MAIDALHRPTTRAAEHLSPQEQWVLLHMLAEAEQAYDAGQVLSTQAVLEEIRTWSYAL